SPPPRAASEGGRPQSSDRGVRHGVRAKRVVLRVGGGRRAGARRPHAVIEQNFGRALTVGVEEELWILDGATLDLAPGLHQLVAGVEGRPLPRVLNTHLPASLAQ